MRDNQKIILYVSGVAIFLLASLIIWIIFFRTSTSEEPAFTEGFGIGDNRSVIVSNESAGGDSIGGGQEITPETIFKIAEGPIAGASLIEVGRPTTTVARYVKQENGHVFDLPLDVPGSLPRAISNTTIPGVLRALWTQRGDGVILQYLSEDVVKSVYLGFPPATTTAITSTRPTKIQFLPDNISGIAASPDGTKISYTLKTSSGSVGYVANADGSGSAQLFTVPLSQILLAWPSNGAILLTTKSGAGLFGMAFSINASTGVVTPLIYAPGLTAIADASFSKVIYQTTPAGAAPSTYMRSVTAGTDSPLSFEPYPEKCIWSKAATSTMYCAAPLGNVPSNYLDLWHLGAASVPDSIYLFDLTVGDSIVVGIPGSRDGGIQTDIAELSLSPNEKYLSFIARNSRELWGVRLPLD